MPLAKNSEGRPNATTEEEAQGPSCLKKRLERLWCGRMYWPVLGSLRGWFSVREHRRDAGKCDNLSFLRVCLSQLGEVLGGTDGYGPLIGGGCLGFVQGLIFDAQQSISRRG